METLAAEEPVKATPTPLLPNRNNDNFCIPGGIAIIDKTNDANMCNHPTDTIDSGNDDDDDTRAGNSANATIDGKKNNSKGQHDIVFVTPHPKRNKTASRRLLAAKKKQQAEAFQAKVSEVLGNLKSGDVKSLFVLGSEYDPDDDATKPGATIHNVTTHIFYRKGQVDEEKLQLAHWTARDLRTLGRAVGASGVTTCSKFKCRCLIGHVLNGKSTAVFANLNNPVAESKQLKVNNGMKLMNICTSEAFRSRFSELNQLKRRKDFESTRSCNPVKAFWEDVAEAFNEDTSGDLYGNVLFGPDDESPDSYVVEWVEQKLVDLRNVTQQTPSSVNHTVRDIMIARERCFSMQKKPGQHDNDFYNSAKNLKLCLFGKNRTVDAKAVYYAHLCCSTVNGIDGSYGIFLDDNLKCDSIVPLDPNDDGPKGKVGNREVAQLIQSISATRETWNEINKKKLEHLAIHKAAARSTLLMNYTRLCSTFQQLKQDEAADCLSFLKTLTKEIRDLETELGITDSGMLDGYV